jgi:hypothetical protein
MDLTSSSTVDLVLQLENININLGYIGKILSEKSFLDSPLFAAMVGVGSTIFIFALGRIMNFFKSRTQENKELYFSLAEKNNFLSPSSIYEDARHRQYGGTTKYPDGTTIIEPEKLIGERMLIQFRRSVKYWNFRHFWLRRWFKKYANLLKRFDKYTDQDHRGFKENMKRAERVHGKIMTYVYKKTGEDQWSLR